MLAPDKQQQRQHLRPGHIRAPYLWASAASNARDQLRVHATRSECRPSSGSGGRALCTRLTAALHSIVRSRDSGRSIVAALGCERVGLSTVDPGSGLLRVRVWCSIGAGACMSLEGVFKGIHRGRSISFGKRRRKGPRALKRLEEAPDLGPQRCRRSGFGMLRQGFGMFTRGMGSMRLGGIAEIKCLRECKRPAM